MESAGAMSCDHDHPSQTIIRDPSQDQYNILAAASAAAAAGAAQYCYNASSSCSSTTSSSNTSNSSSGSDHGAVQQQLHQDQAAQDQSSSQINMINGIDYNGNYNGNYASTVSSVDDASTKRTIANSSGSSSGSSGGDQKLKKGLWSPDEDEKLRLFITTHGHAACWSTIPKLAGNSYKHLFNFDRSIYLSIYLSIYVCMYAITMINVPFNLHRTDLYTAAMVI
jgi:hypothetical protein